MFKPEFVPRSPYAEQLLDQRLMDEICEVMTVDVSDSKQIGYTLLNRRLIGEKQPIVAVGGFMSDLTTPDRAWEGIHLANLNRPVLMLDMPGHGLSSSHTFRQSYDLCIHRSADSQADSLTSAVQRLLAAEDRIDYFGISHGAFLSLKMTEQDPGDRVENVFGIDVTAVKKRSTIGMQLGYVVVDSIIGRKKYFEAFGNTAHNDDLEEFKNEFLELGVEKADNFVKNNPGLFLCNMIASVDARPVALESWARIMPEKSASIKVATAENSSVSDHRAIESFIGSLSLDHQERSHQTVVPGEDHNIGRSHLVPRSVKWAEQAYDQ